MSYLEELFSLAGKTAVVTGAGRGLGRAIAEALGRAGARMLLVGRDGERLEVARSELAALGVEAEAQVLHHFRARDRERGPGEDESHVPGEHAPEGDEFPTRPARSRIAVRDHRIT